MESVEETEILPSAFCRPDEGMTTEECRSVILTFVGTGEAVQGLLSLHKVVVACEQFNRGKNRSVIKPDQRLKG